MKNIFGSNQDSQTLDGQPFVIRSVAKEQQDASEAHSKLFEQLEKKSSLPVWLTIVEFLCAFLFVVVAASVLRAGPKTAWHNAPGLIVAGGISGIAALCLFLCKKRREKNAQPQTNALLEQKISDNNDAAKELRLPAQTLPADVLTFMYKEKNGKTRIRTSLFADYILVETQVFFEDGMFCISDFQDVYGIPLSEIVRVEQGKKRIMATGWNKMQEPTDKCFKQYRLTVNAYGTVFMKPYIMTIKHGDEEFELFIPPYEMEKICFLCGLPFPVAADKNVR